MTKRRPERIALRVVKGGFQPADNLAYAKLKARNYHTDDLVFAELKKPRNPKFHRMAHGLGALMQDNIEGFDHLDAHRVLKRLQLESGVGCEEMAYSLPNGETVLHSIPISLSYESMDQGEFEEVFRGLCHHVSQRYWPDLSEDQIKEMAECMINEDKI